MSDRPLRYLQALNEALHQEMGRDSTVLMLGEDIRGSLRGETKGLYEAYGPERVIDFPISEAAMTGFATGAALSGMRPIVEFQVSSLLYPAFDQLVNQAAKLRFMTGGQATLPVTYIVMASGARMGMAGQHSDNPYPFLLHAGLKVVCPATPHDVKGLTITAIRENDPVSVFAPAVLLGVRGPVSAEMYEIPLGIGEVKRTGSDVTVVAVGHLVNEALRVAETLAGEGIDIEVWDPRTLLPLDRDGMFASVRKTGRVVVFDDSNRMCGFAAEVASIIAERCAADLVAPVKRVTRADVPIPFSRALEAEVLPSREQLTSAIREILGWEAQAARRDDSHGSRSI